MYCAVWGCHNNDPAAADSSIHYCAFPRHPTLAQQWIDACGWPPEQIDLDTARICALHFTEDSYTTEMKVTSDYITCYTKVLKFDAVPTQYLPLTTQIVIKDPEAQQGVQEVILFTTEPAPVEERPPVPMPMTEKYRKVQNKEQLAALESCNNSLRERVATIEKNLAKLKEALGKQMALYKRKDSELSRQHNEYLQNKRAYLTVHKQKSLLSKVFSASQIKILSGKKKIYWSNDDMAVGYIIRHLSNKRCYMYLAKKLNFPLPAISSIKRWMALKSTDGKKEDDPKEDSD